MNLTFRQLTFLRSHLHNAVLLLAALTLLSTLFMMGDRFDWATDLYRFLLAPLFIFMVGDIAATLIIRMHEQQERAKAEDKVPAFGLYSIIGATAASLLLLLVLYLL